MLRRLWFRVACGGGDAVHTRCPRHVQLSASAGRPVAPWEGFTQLDSYDAASFSAAFEKLATRNEAQELALRAMRTRDPGTSSRLSMRALELDPNCLDAFVHMARLSCGTHGDLVEQLRIAVSVGERGLGGAAYFRANKGRFGARAEAHPYLRARAWLAQLLVEAGKIDEAIGHYEELLQLDADDHQGLRYHLLACCFARGKLDPVRRVLNRSQGTDDAVFAWATVLEKLLSGDYASAAESLGAARRLNSDVEAYLTRRKPIPRSLPEQPGLNVEREAIFCATILGPAWLKRRKAVAWLKRIR